MITCQKVYFEIAVINLHTSIETFSDSPSWLADGAWIEKECLSFHPSIWHMQMTIETDIVNMTKTDVAVVAPDYNITEVLHKLVDEPFLPVVDDEGIFQGIITRKSILKAVNALLHDFNKDYEIRCKWEIGFQPF